MEAYTANDYRYGRHEYRITLMCDGYVGHITSWVGGNTKGRSVLNHALDFFDGIGGKFTSDCNFEIDDSEMFCSFTLHDKDGDELVFDNFDFDEVTDYVVAVEIVSFTPMDI